MTEFPSTRAAQTIPVNRCAMHCLHGRTGGLCAHPEALREGFATPAEDARKPGHFCGPEALHMTFEDERAPARWRHC